MRASCLAAHASKLPASLAQREDVIQPLSDAGVDRRILRTPHVGVRARSRFAQHPYVPELGRDLAAGRLQGARHATPTGEARLPRKRWMVTSRRN